MPDNLPVTSNLAPSRARNLIVAVAAVVLATAMVLGIRTQSAVPSLPELAASAVPYEVAQINGKPTLLEFYANWCGTCQAMAGDMAELRETYGDRVNFVMLNIDNNKWLPEMLAYRVEGIPHFVYSGADGAPIATAIGEQPRQILSDNLNALIAQAPLPHQQTFGRTSAVEGDFLSRQSTVNDNPRAHGNVVTN
ncbi:thioredoxin domain-containing protein [Nodosilinea sp. E11]|uniref:thioredoxin domain-containing protein n=1 Tax=Nodosilinea sp. E11 TaxID=3037479 RepID=UPI00293523AA|nr:thioredoxin domain-containing protein [Nodosilinea sp. E11]WOD37867.1 thioredoxin domain-containing protein [Nodosilinea sp. E11]